MKKILHILRKDDRLAIETISKQAMHDKVTVLMIQEATQLKMDGIEGIEVFVLGEDMRHPTRHQKIGYGEMIDMIFKADQVITW